MMTPKDELKTSKKVLDAFVNVIESMDKLSSILPPEMNDAKVELDKVATMMREKYVQMHDSYEECRKAIKTVMELTDGNQRNN